MKRSTASIVLIAVLVLLVLVSVRTPQAPSVVPADAPADGFSAERALRHIEAIAREPHPMGTAEHARVRDYVVGELRRLGVEPELQEAVVARARGGRKIFGRVINVLARLDGERDGKAVLLMSHYDTVPGSPGAGDDSTGVATMLETLRALGNGPPLENDVIFLFTDGEEISLLGAHAFVDQHPWANDVGVVLNFEARGHTGPSLMFETSAGNAPLIAALDRAVARPAAASASYEIYSRMPNDTDFTPFKEAGKAGLNFSFIGGGTAYHTAQDTLERLDPRSVQMHGEAALALTRQFGGADLTDSLKSRDEVYFNLPGNTFVHYSSAWVKPSAVALVIAAAALLVLGFRRRKLTWGGFAVSLAAVLLGAAVVGWLASVAGGAYMRPYNFVLWRGWTSLALDFLALCLATAGVTLLAVCALRRYLRAENLFGAGLLIWTVIAAAISWFVSGASYFFALPLAAAVVAGAMWMRREESEKASIPYLLVLVFSAAVTVFLWAPMYYLLTYALGRGAGVVVGATMPLLLFGPLMPYVAGAFPAKGRSAWLTPTVLVALALAVILAVDSGSDFSDRNRRRNTVFYHLDTETGKAEWFTFDQEVDEWTSQFLSESPEARPRPSVAGDGSFLANDAPEIGLEGATVDWLGAEPGGDGQRLRMRLSWPFEVHRATLRVSSDSPIRAVSSAGQSLASEKDSETGEAPHSLWLLYFAPPRDGFPLTVELEEDGPVRIEAFGQRYDLPEIGEPRPSRLMASPSWLTDSTFVRSVHQWTPDEEEEPHAVTAETAAVAGGSL